MLFVLFELHAPRIARDCGGQSFVLTCPANGIRPRFQQWFLGIVSTRLILFLNLQIEGLTNSRCWVTR